LLKNEDESTNFRARKNLCSDSSCAVSTSARLRDPRMIIQSSLSMMASQEAPLPAATTPPQQRKEPPVVLIEDNNNDEQDEEVKRLAEALAPQVAELEELLTSPPPLDSARGSRVSLDDAFNDEDDDMRSEEKRLEASEQLLRQELEFAQDWTHLMASPLRDDHIARELAVNYGIEDETETLTEPEEHIPQSYTIAHHAETLGLEVDGGWYVLESKLANDVYEYVVPLPVEQLKRLYIGIVGGAEGEVTPAELAVAEEAQPSVAGAISPADPQTPKRNSTPSARSSIVNRMEPLPVRTAIIWIRADVLCGAVMDAIYHALEGMGGEVIKRQGGVLRGIVKPCAMTNTDTGYVTHCPGYLVDVQLCTYKGTARNKQGQRSLILRIYHYYHDDMEEEDNDEELPATCETADESNNILLKEAAALVQKMEAGSTEIRRRSSWFSSSKVCTDDQEMRNVISQQLLSGYRPCPSVLDGRLTLPVLSEQDAPVIHAAWRWIDVCWNELENRDLCYRCVA